MLVAQLHGLTFIVNYVFSIFVQQIPVIIELVHYLILLLLTLRDGSQLAFVEQVLLA